MNRTKREKIEAIANTADYNPAEAAVAADMLAKVAPDRLDEIAADIMSSWSRGVEEEFRIGHLLREAAAILPPEARVKDERGRQAKSPFGEWVRAQGFPFSMKTAYRLRVAADREDEVRALIGARAPGSRDMGVNTAIALLLAAGATGVKRSESEARDNPGFLALRRGIHALLQWEVDDAGVGRAKANALKNLPHDQLLEIKALVEALAQAYREAMVERQ